MGDSVSCKISQMSISQVGQSATYVEALNTARAAAVQIFKVVFQCLISDYLVQIVKVVQNSKPELFSISDFGNKVIDRVPDIDSASVEGLKPDGIKGQVGIKIPTQTKLHFSDQFQRSEVQLPC